MLILYSDETKETEIQLFDKDIEELQSKLLENNSILYCQEEHSNPLTHSRYLHSILVQVVPKQPVELMVASDKLLIRGDLSKLAVLAEDIASLKDTPFGYHIHIEYFDEHFYLGASSLPVVLVHSPTCKRT